METTTAKITKIELVNGCMLSFEVALPAGKKIEAFDIEAIFGSVLNSSTRGSTGFFNVSEEETTLKVGDEITTDGEVIEAAEASGKIEIVELKGKESDYRDAYAEKNS